MSAADKQPSWLERISNTLFLGEPKDREDLTQVLRDAEQRALLDTDALAMIEAILNFSEMQVRDIMIPRSQMVMVEQSDPPEVFIPMIIQSGHSRFPVINESPDDVVGILLAKDLLNYTFGDETKFTLRDILRPANFVPESKRLNILLKEFRAKHHHLAMVVDEYGGVSGLVTIEDVLEEIVGEIEDEYDTEDKTLIHPQNNNAFIVNALTPIEDFNEYFKTQFSDDTYDTIGGYILQRFGHVPKRGESVTLDKLEFKILQADKRRVKSFKVIKKK